MMASRFHKSLYTSLAVAVAACIAAVELLDRNADAKRQDGQAEIHGTYGVSAMHHDIDKNGSEDTVRISKYDAEVQLDIQFNKSSARLVSRVLGWPLKRQTVHCKIPNATSLEAYFWNQNQLTVRIPGELSTCDWRFDGIRYVSEEDYFNDINKKLQGMGN
jgi:hypothetical protein